jgi:hypothetical protein
MFHSHEISMADVYEAVIVQNWGELKDRLDLRGTPLLDRLLEKRMLSFRHLHIIQAKATPAEQAEEFLHILLTQNATIDFLRVLQSTQGSLYTQLREQILEEGGSVLPIDGKTKRQSPLQ